MRRSDKCYNPKGVITIGDNAFYGYSKNLIIYEKKGSYAEEYAKNKAILFQVK